MTTSTAGMSFNSPPATERACGFDNEDYMEDCEANQANFEMKPKRSSYINIQNFEGDPSSTS